MKQLWKISKKEAEIRFVFEVGGSSEINSSPEANTASSNSEIDKLPDSEIALLDFFNKQVYPQDVGHSEERISKISADIQNKTSQVSTLEESQRMFQRSNSELQERIPNRINQIESLLGENEDIEAVANFLEALENDPEAAGTGFLDKVDLPNEKAIIAEVNGLIADYKTIATNQVHIAANREKQRIAHTEKTQLETDLQNEILEINKKTDEMRATLPERRKMIEGVPVPFHSRFLEAWDSNGERFARTSLVSWTNSLEPGLDPPTIPGLGSPDICTGSSNPNFNNTLGTAFQYKFLAPAKNMENIESSLSKTSLSKTAKINILKAVKNLSLDPNTTEEDMMTILLAGLVSQGEITQLQSDNLRDTEFFKLVLERLEIVKRGSAADAEVGKMNRIAEAESLIKWYQSLTGNTLFNGVLSDETISEFKALETSLEGENTNDINQDILDSLLKQASDEINRAHSKEAYRKLSREDKIIFNYQQHAFSRKLSNTSNLTNSFDESINRAENKVVAAQTTKENLTDTLTDFENNPDQLTTNKAYATSESFRRTGKVSPDIAKFLTNPKSDFSKENVKRMTNLLNSDAYLNASTKEKSQLFNKNVNTKSNSKLPSSFGKDSMTASKENYTNESFASSLPFGSSEPIILPNGNISYEAGGTTIEVDLERNIMFPHSADGRAQTWLSMAANPANTPAIQFFQAAMEAGVNDKEESFASMVRSGGVWKNEIFWRNLLAPKSGRILQPKEIEGIQAIENRGGIKQVFLRLNLVDDAGNLLPGNAPAARDEFFDILISAANGNFAPLEEPNKTL